MLYPYKEKGAQRMERVFIHRLCLPRGVFGAVTEDTDGNYNIFVQKNLPDNKVVPTIAHELRHCSAGHLHDDILSATEKENAT